MTGGIFQGRTTLVKRVRLTPEIVHLVISAPEAAALAQPGQFVMLKVGTGWDPLLRRPLSIHQTDPAQGTLEVVFRVVGRGTSLLADLEEGEIVDLEGPLGKGFCLDGVTSATEAFLVGGGLGSAPLPFLARVLRNKTPRIRAFLGARNREEAIGLAELTALGAQVQATTEDGSLGEKGLVTGILQWALGENSGPRTIFACGPRSMLAALAPLARDNGCGYQASLEARMACGVGACLGCSCKETVLSLAEAAGAGSDGLLSGFRACADGPVFILRKQG